MAAPPAHAFRGPLASKQRPAPCTSHSRTLPAPGPASSAVQGGPGCARRIVPTCAAVAAAPPPPPTAAIVAPWVEPEVWPTLDAAELMPGMNGRRLLQTVNLTPGVPFNTFNPVALQNIKVLFIPSEAPSPQCRPVQAGLTRLIVRLP